MRASSSLGLGLASTLAVAVACAAKVDQERYAPGDEGHATFTNESRVTTWLGGCATFEFQKLEASEWVDRGPPHVCVWEGFAQPVESGESRRDPFVAPSEPGVWRLRYATGLGCAADQPLGADHCAFLGRVLTPPFQVAELCEPVECGPPLGMPNWLCPDGSVGGPTDRCLRDPETGRCGWEIRSCPD